MRKIHDAHDSEDERHAHADQGIKSTGHQPIKDYLQIAVNPLHSRPPCARRFPPQWPGCPPRTGHSPTCPQNCSGVLVWLLSLAPLRSRNDRLALGRIRRPHNLVLSPLNLRDQHRVGVLSLGIELDRTKRRFRNIQVVDGVADCGGSCGCSPAFFMASAPTCSAAYASIP